MKAILKSSLGILVCGIKVTVFVATIYLAYHTESRLFNKLFGGFYITKEK